MKKATVTLKSVTPITFGKYHQVEKLPKELADAYEKRTWKEKLHYDVSGAVIIPGNMIGNAIRESARFLSIPVPGKGKSTFTKHFDAGIIVTNDIKLKIKKDDVGGDARHVPSDGRPGGTSRVMKIFPKIMEWVGTIEITITDDIITADVFEQVLRNAGLMIGIGTWRPRNRGMNGRFEVVTIKWEDS